MNPKPRIIVKPEIASLQTDTPSKGHPFSKVDWFVVAQFIAPRVNAVEIEGCFLGILLFRKIVQTLVKEFSVNIKDRYITKPAFILIITTLIVGLSACDRVHQVIEPDTPMEERDHVWVVDQNGVEAPVPGTWVLVSHTHLNSTSTIGESFTLPPDDPHSIQISDGTYTDGEGILWTKVKITTSGGDQWQFLERVDTSVTPHRLYVVVTVDNNGLPTLKYGEYPFDLPRHNFQIWEKQ